MWSLDGELFGICRDAPVDRELTRRLVRLATAIGAVAVNVHCVDGSYDPAVLSEARRAEALAQGAALPALVRPAVPGCGTDRPDRERAPDPAACAGRPWSTPPSGWSRRTSSPACRGGPGAAPDLDTSHAQLAVNALRGVPPPPALPELAGPAAY